MDSNTAPAPSNIHEAMNMAMQEVGYVRKKKSGGLKYTFAGERAFIQAIRPVLVDLGVYIYPCNIVELKLDSYDTARNTMNRSVVSVEYQFTHAPSETSIVVNTVGEASDVGDKATAKAMTQAFKYAMRQALLIETGDDPDEYASEPRVRPSGKQYGDGTAVPAGGVNVYNDYLAAHGGEVPQDRNVLSAWYKTTQGENK